MKFNTRSKVAVAALIASSAIATGAFNSGSLASASFCRLDNYVWNGSSTAPFIAGTISAPVGDEVLETIYITYAATGEGEQIRVAIGGVGHRRNRRGGHERLPTQRNCRTWQWWNDRRAACQWRRRRR